MKIELLEEHSLFWNWELFLKAFQLFNESFNCIIFVKFVDYLDWVQFLSFEFVGI